MNPSNIFSDIGTDTVKTLENPIADVGIASAIALPFLAPEIGGLLGLGGAADAAGGLSAASAAGAPLDLLAGGAADPLAGGALGFGGDVADSSLSGFLANPAAAAGGAGAPLSLAPTAPAAGGFDLSTIGPGAASTTGAPLDILAGGGGAGAPLNIAPGAGAAAGGAAGAAPTGIAASITNALAPVTNTLKAVSPVLAAGGLGYNLYSGYQQKEALNALNQQEKGASAAAAATAATENNAAGPLLNSGQTLMNYLTTGTLPPQFQAQVQQSVAAAKASIIQGYASRGMSTNPQQNSGLAQDLANVDLQAQSLQANLEGTLSAAGSQMVQTANSLLAAGLSATEFSSELPLKVASLNSQLNQQMATAVSNFAAALNGSGSKSGITLQLPQNAVSPTGQIQI